MIIAVDFDGTCVTHAFPEIGKDIGAVQVLKWLVEQEHKIILYTMRDKQYLVEAMAWFKLNEIPLFSVNKNPTQHKWTTSPKLYAHLYIDDAALGCPLKFDSELSDKPFVDWEAIEKYLKIYLEDEIT